MREVLRQLTTCVTSGAIVVSQTLPAYADVTAQENAAGTGTITQTNVAVNGDITTTTVENRGGKDVGFNVFSEFNIGTGEEFTLIQPSNADILLNVVRNTATPLTASTVAGTLNARHADGVTTSNVFIVDPNGFVVADGGVINAGNLTISAASTGEADALVAGIGADNGAAARLFAGNEAMSGESISVEAGATINAAGLELRSGLQLIVDGVITVTDPNVVAGSPGVAVNTDGRPQATGVSVSNGVIRFGAAGDVAIGGQVTARSGTDGGAVVADAGGNLRLKTGALVDAGDAGTIVLFTEGSAILEEGTALRTTAVPGAGGFAMVRALAAISTGAGNGAAVALEGGTTVLEAATIAIDHDIATNGGDLIAVSPSVTVGSGADLDATGTTSGLIALVADNAEGGGIWSVSSVGAVAGVTIDDATISAGAVVISSAAVTTNVVREADLADVEDENDRNITDIQGALDEARTRVTTAITGKLLELDARQPLQIKTLDSTATVRVTDATITADGTWSNPNGLNGVAGSADNGVLNADGAGLSAYLLPRAGALSRAVLLPSQFNATNTDVFVQAYAKTAIDIDVGDKALSASVARTERTAAVILDDTVITGAGGVVINSAAQVVLDVTTAARDIEGKAFGLTYATSDTRNQLVVNGGTITGADVAIQALTGKTHSITNEVRSGTGAKGAAAITIGISSNTTEAVVNGAITADNLLVNAETLYFDLSRTTNATVGVDEDRAEADETSQSGLAEDGESFGDGVNGDASGDTADAPSGGTNYGLAVDVQLDKDTTRAVISGTYTDLALTAGLTETAAIVQLTGDLTLTATQRFARSDEGGKALRRNVHAILGALPDDATGNFGATSVMSMTGTVTAALGADATVVANAANVAALTSYRDYADGAANRAQIAAFIDEISDLELQNAGDIRQIAALPTPSDLLDETTYLTTSSGVRMLVQDDASQAKAKGAGVTYANLTNTTTAVIRDGATVETTAALGVTARTEGVFFHDSPNGAAAAQVAGETPGTPGSVVGGSLVFGRTTAETSALVEGGTDLDTGDLNVLADTALVQIVRTEAGGAGASKSINAAIAVNAVETKTFARVGELAVIDATGAMTIAATDASQIIAVAGSKSESAGRAAGAGVAVNLINRDTVAALGSGAATLGTAGEMRLTADSLSVRAANTGVAMAAGIAATKTSGSLASEPPADSSTNTNAPTHLMRADESAALNSQQSTAKRPNQSGQAQNSGWAISGAAALNIMTRDDATARVATNATVTLTGALDITATSNASTLAIGGAVFRGMGPASKSTGLAGAFAVNFDTNGRNTRAILTGANVVAGSADITATDTSDNIAVAAGGGGKSKAGAAIAGSAAFVLETGNTETQVSGAAITVTSDLSVTATNAANLMALGGAAGAHLSLKGAGIGTGVAIITSTRDAEVTIADGVALSGDVVTVTSDAQQSVVSITASIAAGQRSYSGSFAVNTLTGDSRVLIGTAGGAGATLQATTLTLAATDANDVWTLSGAIGVGKSGAFGGALSINTIVTSTELAVLNSTISGPNTVSLASLGTSMIKSRAAAGSASAGATVNLGATVNTVSADTLTRFDGSTVSTGTAAFSATNARVIQSRAGGAAATSANAAGLALAANTLAGNDTRVSLNGAQITATGDVTAIAATTSQIDSKAAAITFGNSNSGAASTAVGVIATQTRVQAAGATLNAGGAVTLAANKTSSVDILAGSIALSGSGNAVGGAVAVNVLRDTVTADVATDAAITAGALNVAATNGSSLTARSIAGAGSGSNAFNASIVYNQIGRKPSGAPSVQGGAGEPAPTAAADNEAARDTALASVTARTDTTYALDQDDLTRARVELGGGAVNVGALTITAADTSAIDANAGGFTGSGSNGGGVAVNTALLFGKTEATLDVREGLIAALGNDVTVRATQNGVLDLDARAGSAARTYSGAGSIIVGVFDRKADARISGYDGADGGTEVAATTLRTNGANVTLEAVQAGSFNARAGAASAGGSGAIGGSVIVTTIADDATATLRDLTLDQRVAAPGGNTLAGAGALTIGSRNGLSVDTLSQSFGLSANLAFAGSFGVTVIETDTITQLQRARVDAGAANINSVLDNQLTTKAQSLAGGKVAGAFAVISNTSDGRVLTDINGADVRTDTTLVALSDANVVVDAYAASGAAAATASLSGSALSNDIGNRAETILRDTSGEQAPRLLSRGSVAVLSQATATYNLGGGIAVAGAGSASFGGTVVVTQSRNQALTTLRDDASVDGLGYGTLSYQRRGQLDPTVVRGVVLDSYAKSDLFLTSVTASVAGSFSGAAALAYNTTSDTALTSVGQVTLKTPAAGGNPAEFASSDAFVNGSQGALTGADAAFFAPYGVTGPNAGQDSLVTALTDNSADLLVGTATASGTAAAGASSVITLVTSRAEVVANVGQIAANDNVLIDAKSVTAITPRTVGLSASSVSLAASVAYSEVASRALVTLNGASITAGNDLTVNALAVNSVSPLTGNFAAGKGAGAGSFSVSKIASEARVSTAGITVERPILEGDETNPLTTTTPEIARVNTVLTADGDATVAAATNNTLGGRAVAGSVGGGAIAFAANIAMVESQTGVVIGGDQSVVATDVDLTALETTTLTGQVGMGAGAAAAIGGALDYQKFAGDATVVIGENARITARQDITVSADANRNITSNTGVASIAGSSATAALSIIDVGGLNGSLNSQANGMLASVQTSLNSDDSGSQSDTLVTRAGANAARDVAAGSRQTGAIAAARVDDVGVTIRDGAVLQAGNVVFATNPTESDVVTIGNIAISGDIRTAIKQNVGVVSLSSAGLSASVGLVSLKSNVAVVTGDGSQVLADGTISLAARTGNLNGQNAVDSAVLNLAAAGAGAAAAGVSVVDNTSVARVVLDGSSRLAGYVDGRAANVSLTADRSERVTGTTLNGVISAGVSVGVSLVDLESAGRSEVSLRGVNAANRATITAGAVTVSAHDGTTAAASAIGAAGGVLAGSGVVTEARNIARSELNLIDAGIDAYSVNMTNISDATVTATSNGLSLGGLAVGVTFATAEFGSTVTTNITGTNITANSVDIATAVQSAQGANAVAVSNAATGGLAAGAGTTATATTAYNATTAVAGTTNIFGLDTLRLGTAANAVTANATAKGLTIGGAIAIGVVRSEAGQIGNREAAVQTLINAGTLVSFGNVELYADNSQTVDVNTVAGSGGLVSGSGSIAETRVNARTRVVTGQGGQATLIAGDLVDPTQTDGTLIVRAAQATDLRSNLNNTNASAIGFSGGRTPSTLVYLTDVSIGGGTVARGNRMDIGATHAIDRPVDGFNIRSNSGGVFDGASIESLITVDAQTNVRFEDNSVLAQMGDLDFYQSILIGITTDTNIVDRIKLDAGGGLALPLGKSQVRVNRNTANVTFGRTRIDAIGPLRVYTGSTANLRTEAFSTSYGLAGSASANTQAHYVAENKINIEAGAALVSLYDVILRAGYGRAGLQSVAVNAESRVFNKTAIPVTLPTSADASAATTSRVTIADGARVYAYQDVFVEADSGSRQIRGYGLSKDFYLEILAAIANAVGGVFGLDPVVFDIRRGSSVDTSNNGIIVNGELRAGAYNRRILTLDANLVDQSGAAGTRAAVPFSTQLDVATSIELQVRLDAVNVRLADPNLSLDDRTTALATRNFLITELNQAVPRSLTNDIITIAPLYAAEGAVTLLADYLEGRGDISAAGDVLVDIVSDAGATLRIEGIAVSRNQGGSITLNNRIVRSNADITEISDGGSAANNTPGPLALALEYDLTDGPNQINIITNAPSSGLADLRDGSIDIVGDVTNDRGNILVASNKGSTSIRAAVAGVDITISAAQDINAIVEGFFRAGGDPARGYQDLFDRAAAGSARAIWRPSGSTVPRSFTFRPRVSKSGISAGRNVNFIATTVNINSIIKAGTGTYDVIINAGIDAQIAALRATNGTGRTILYDNAVFATPGTVKSPHVASNTNVSIFYNFDTDQIEIDDMLVRGGQVSITGNIISTGTGRIEALDGQGALNLVSAAETDVVLKAIDLGGTAGGAGLAGLVRLTDTAKRTSDGRVLVTEYRRLNGEVTVVSNETTETFTDPVFGVTERPTFVVSGQAGFANADGVVIADPTGRSAIYNPLANRDYVVRNTTQYNAVMDQKFVYYVKGDWRFISTKVPNRTLYLRREAISGTTYLQDAPSIEASIGTSDYTYRFESSASPDFALPAPISDPFQIPFAAEGYNIFESHSGGVHKITRQRTIGYTETEIETHRLKADQPINIFFSGSDESSFNIQTQGNVILSEAIANGAGPSTITSLGGSILTSGNTVRLTTQDLTLSAENGAIAGQGGAFQIDLLGDSKLTARAADGIDIFETSGDLNLGAVSTTARDGAGQTLRTGQINLTAQGSIVQADSGTDPAYVLSGSDITLTALEGAVGSGDAQPLLIDTSTDGVLNIAARDDVNVTEISGNLGLGLVSSLGGSVTLDVPTGALVDRNDVQERDTRTLAQLNDLWDKELGLLSGNTAAQDPNADPNDPPERFQAQIANLQIQRKADYQVYWALREANGGAAQTYVMTAEEADGLLIKETIQVDDGGLLVDQEVVLDRRLVEARQADMDALYAKWNAEEDVFDTDYTYTVSDAEAASLTDGYLWTTQQLTRSIQDGTITRIGDTDTDIETPNISANQNITVRALGVGELLEPYQVAANGTLTDRDFEVLATAGPGDVTVVGDTTFIRQEQDVDFAFDVATDGTSLGVLRVIASDQDIYLGAETAARLANLDSTKQVQVRVNGLLTDARDAQFAVNGQILTLEAGNDGSIGSVANPLTVNILPDGNLTARAGGDVNIAAPVGDLPLQTIFAGGAVTLQSPGAILDTIGTATPRIVASDISLTAGTIGTDATPVGIAQTSATSGAVDVTSTAGAINLAGYGDISLRKLTSAAGGRFDLTGTAALLLTGDNTISFDMGSTFALSTDNGLSSVDSTGTDITGGTLVVGTDAAWGEAGAPVTTDISSLSYGATTAGRDISLWLSEADNLTLATLDMSTAATVADLTIGGTLSGDIRSAGDVRVRADATTLGSVTAGTLSVTTTNALALRDADVVGAAIFEAGQDLGLGSVMAQTLTSVSAGDSTIMNAQIVGVADVMAGQTLTIDTVAAQTFMSLSTGDTTVTDAQIGGAATLTAGQNLAIDSILAQTLMTVSTDDTSVMNAQIVGVADVMAGQTLTIDTVAAQTFMSLSTGDTTVTDAQIGGAATLTARQNLAIDSIVAQTLMTVSTDDTLVTNAQIGGAATLTAGQDLTVDVAVAQSLTFGSTLTTTLADARARETLIATSGTNLTIGSAQAGTAMDLNAGGMLQAMTLNALTLLSYSSGATTIDRLTVSGVATLESDASLDLTTAEAGLLDASADQDISVAQATLTDGFVGVAGANLSFGTIVAANDVTLRSGQDLTGTNLLATQLFADAGRALTLDLGTTDYSMLTAGGTLSATLDSLLTDAATSAGTLDLALTGRSGAIGTVKTDSGALNLTTTTAATTAGQVRSESGKITMAVAGDLTQRPDSVIGSNTGAVTLTVAGDFNANRVETNSLILNLTVDGALNAVDPTQEIIAANAIGALTTLRLGESREQSETGLRLNVALLDANVSRGDLHLLETDGVRAVSVVAESGTVDLNSRGTLDVGSLRGQTVVLTSAQDITGSNAEIAAEQIYLLAFGGAITGLNGTFDVDTSDDAVLVLNALDDVSLTEQTGNLRVAVANAVAGDLTISGADPSGLLDVGALGSGGTMTLTSAGDLSLNAVGGGQIDMIDEDALNLIDRSDARYGLTDLSTPRALVLTALGEEGTLTMRLGQVQDRAVLTADNIVANLYDATPTDGLDLTAVAPDDGFASVNIRTVADGYTGVITDPFGLTDVFVDLEKPIDRGLLRLVDSRLSGGDIYHGGQVLSVESTQVSGDVWLRLRDNDVLATVDFKTLDPLAEIQILALDNLTDETIPLGSIAFLLADNGAVVTSNKLVLTRDIDVLVLNAAPGTLTSVLLDQLQILTTGPQIDGISVGRTEKLEELLLPKLFEEGVRGTIVSLPLTLAAVQ